MPELALPALSLSKGSLSFGDVDPGSTSGSQTVIATNDGERVLAISAGLLGGSDPNAFEIVSDACSDQSIAPEGTCSVELRFVPTTVGGALIFCYTCGGANLFGRRSATGELQAAFLSTAPAAFQYAIVGIAGSRIGSYPDLSNWLCVLQRRLSRWRRDDSWNGSSRRIVLPALGRDADRGDPLHFA